MVLRGEQDSPVTDIAAKLSAPSFLRGSSAQLKDIEIFYHLNPKPDALMDDAEEDPHYESEL
jgi:hypothetical protein